MQVGASDAASEHYRHYANLMQKAMDERAPPMQELLRGEYEHPG
jgi:hypothetical protein